MKYVLVILNTTEKFSSYLIENMVRVCYKQLHKEVFALDRITRNNEATERTLRMVLSVVSSGAYSYHSALNGCLKLWKSNQGTV